MRTLKAALCPPLLLLVFCAWALSQDPPADTQPNSTPPQATAPAPAAPSSFEQVIELVVAREHFFNQQMRHMHPLVETYIQNLKSDQELGAVPVSDQYFLGRLDLSGGLDDRSFINQPGFGHKILSRLSSLYSAHLLPLGFAQMVMVDSDFQRQYYEFTFVRREFLGELRCLVIDVHPRQGAGNGRFIGRIWVEDQDYNIVRFNGTYTSHKDYREYLHFDSWRLNMRPGLWLPAFIYSEEGSGRVRMAQSFHLKAQTRLWGYDVHRLTSNEEFTQIVVDSPQSVQDQSPASQDATPVQSERLWQREAEDNALDRLQKIGLIAPESDVDKVLGTVINNLVVTNNLNIEPEVRTRVLLTTPMESFTIGHTIVISRGLLDVLPDEASLAMVLSHELGHIMLGDHLDTTLAFNDRLFFPDENTFKRLDFTRNPAEEEAADKKAMELLANSPYKDKLANAGLFLKALQQEQGDLKNLIRPHLGNSIASGDSVRMSSLLTSAPQLETKRTDQIAALPLGSRVKVDPWSNRVELIKTKPLPLMSAEEKMPFEITPFFPYLTRISNGGTEKVALTGTGNK